MPRAGKVREQYARQRDGAQAIEGRNSTSGVQRQLPCRDLPVLGEGRQLSGACLRRLVTTVTLARD